MQSSNGGSRFRLLRNILITVLVVFIFAYAIEVTDVNLREPLEPQRQANLVGLLRDLARPDLFDYEAETQSIDLSIRMPCPEEVRGSQISSQGRVLLLAPNCASTTQDPLTLNGQGYPPNARGIVRWYPAGATTVRTLAEFRASEQGNFSVTFTMPDIRPTEEPQRIEVIEVLSRNISGISDITVETFERIVETILMALVASTIGTILAVPISFLGARNLMSTVGSPLAAIMAGIIALPIGYFVGDLIGTALAGLAAALAEASALYGLGALLVVILLAVIVLRYVPRLSGGSAWTTGLGVGITLLLGILAVALLADLGLIAGAWLEEVLGFFGFVGNFFYVMSGFLSVSIGWLTGLIAGAAAASYASRYGQEAVLHMSDNSARLLTAALTLVGTALLVFGIAYAINWICLLGVCEVIPQDQLLLVLGSPALVIGVLAALLSLRVPPKKQMPLGMVTYSITRTILNTLRSIEPVIMGFVLVVWVGIGPFAGVLALMLHSIADLGKLFSEQVENIEEGPLEAVTATGANRVQTIVYAVVPQIIPHYTAFIFYRWDINVRLSTIIGFVGGGGIGLLLFRSANLTQYRQAAVMVIAIAIVVTALDYISSKIRTRII